MFTDKTGTLTENEMQFRECSVNGTKYREVNGKLVPEGMTDDSPDGSTAHLVTSMYSIQALHTFSYGRHIYTHTHAHTRTHTHTHTLSVYTILVCAIKEAELVYMNK